MSLLGARSIASGWESRVKPALQELFSRASNDPRFCEAQTFREQCRFFFENAPEVSPNQVAKLFGIDPHCVRDQYQKLRQPPGPNGRPTILNTGQVAAVLAFLAERAQSPAPATVNECLNFIAETFDIDMIPDTFRKWLNKSTAFCTIEGQPMEEKRLEVTGEQIGAYFERLHFAIEGVPASLVFNLDESGFQRYVDARNQVIIVEKSRKREFFGIGRAEKRATFLATVSADGGTVKPLIILPRATVETELLLAGYTEDKVILAHSDTGFITSALFERYVTDVLIPNINLRRWELNYQGPAVLIWDNCSCHCNNEILELLEGQNIRLVTLPPHSSDQLQPLDVGLFGNMKGAQSRVHVPEEMTMQSRQVIRILSGFYATFHPLAITSAFRRAGVSLKWESGRLFCAVTPATCSALRCDIPERTDDLLQMKLDRFEKTRVEIRDGLWGTKPDRLLEYLGVNPFTGEIRDLPIVPQELEEWRQPTHLMNTINELWNGELPEDDEADDFDYLPDLRDEPLNSALQRVFPVSYISLPCLYQVPTAGLLYRQQFVPPSGRPQ